MIGLAISGLGTNGLCSGGRGDGTAVRLAALLRAARLSAHRGEEAHQQLQQGARTRLLRLKVCPVSPLKPTYVLSCKAFRDGIHQEEKLSRPFLGLNPGFFSPKS